MLSSALLFLTLLPPQRLALEPVASGFDAPLFVAAPAGDRERLFVLEQNTARVYVIKNGVTLPTPFLNLDSFAGQFNERGLLGLAFHPQYAQNGHFYVNFTDLNGDTVVARFQVLAGDPDRADPASGASILFLDQPRANHNGGMLAFGPRDGYLYVGMGDGGGSGDPDNNAQNGQSLLGKMLRLDVDGGFPYAIPADNPFVNDPSFRDEIWSYGWRNPWRFSFDRLNGDLYAGDVGQFDWEEIDYQPGSSAGGENYGWRVTEGRHCFNPSTGCNPAGITPPVHEYGHNAGQCIIGGYAYRGGAIPGLAGTYLFGDYVSGRIWSFRMYGRQKLEFLERTDELNPGGALVQSLSSFGEDADAEIYLTDLSDGEIYRVVADLMALTLTPLVAGQPATATVDLAAPGALVSFYYSLSGPGASWVPALQTSLGLAAPKLAGAATADASGQATLGASLPGILAGREVWMQAAAWRHTSNVVRQVVQ